MSTNAKDTHPKYSRHLPISRAKLNDRSITSEHEMFVRITRRIHDNDDDTCGVLLAKYRSRVVDVSFAHTAVSHARPAITHFQLFSVARVLKSMICYGHAQCVRECVHRNIMLAVCLHNSVYFYRFEHARLRDDKSRRRDV